MCGIGGVVAWDERFRMTRETLFRMSSGIAHRGPDGEGIYLNHEDPVKADRPQVGLVHRRLAIIDPDPHANQPFTDHAGRWIVFNGEIYNFRELRVRLTQLRPDYAWRTRCDTEALLVAYDAWGESCVEHLNGMFAFAIWDEPAKRLFLARDRMGQKPLYFAYAPGRGALAFASEIRPLLELPWVDRETSFPALEHYLRWGYTPAEGSIYRGIFKLLPSERMTCAPGGAESRSRYFDPNVAQAAPSNESSHDTTRRLFLQAVRRQLVADVPLGCFLSGGIDSSVTAAAMKAAVGDGQPVLTFSIGFDDPRYDETKYAAAVAEHLKTQHRMFIVQPQAAEDLPKLAEVFGEPFADSSALPMHYLSRETRQFVKVALSGDGGDELFGGYDRYRAMAVASQFEKLPLALRTLITARMWQALPGVHPKSRITRIKRLLSTLAQPPGRRYASIVQLFDGETIQKLLGDRAAGAEESMEQRFAGFESAGRDAVQAAIALDRITYLPEDLLTKADRSSMLHALEVRSPFMDHELVQFAAGLTADQLLKGGSKRMLREAFAADLPAEVFKRKKMGFAIPIGNWFRGQLKPMLHDHLFATNSFATAHFDKKALERLVNDHETHRLDHSQRLHALLMLELWRKRQNLSIP